MTWGVTGMSTRIGSDFVASLVTLRVAISRMTGFHAKVSITRQGLSATFSARNSVNMTCDTFPQFVVTVAPFFRQGSAGWTVFLAMTMMHYRMGAGVGTGAKSLANGGFNPTSNGGINYFGPAKTGQFVETDVGACRAVSTVAGF